MDAGLARRIEDSIGNIPLPGMDLLKHAFSEGSSGMITQYIQGNALIALADAYRNHNKTISEAEALIAASMGSKLGCQVVAEIGYSNLESVHVAVTVAPFDER